MPRQVKSFLEAELFESKHVTMQRIRQLPAAGYTRFLSGVVHIQKAVAFHDKMNARYRVLATRSQRVWRRSKGLAVCQMFMYPYRRTDDLEWFILATDGAWAEPHDDVWKSLSDHRMRCCFSGDYELVRLPVPRERARKILASGLKPTENPWTWKMTKGRVGSWRERLRKAVIRWVERGNDVDLRQALDSLSRSPGHAGVHEQVGELFGYVYRQLRKANLIDYTGQDSLPVWLRNRHWAGGIKRGRTFRLRDCQDRYLAGIQPWFPTRRRGALAIDVVQLTDYDACD